jgi:hypothetical protein
MERDLLLGTCSSGRCRYDEGVEDGTFTLRLRDEDGKLISKLETRFYLQKGGLKLSSADNDFSLSSTKLSKNTYYIVVGTFGLPKDAPGDVVGEPYGIFTKGSTKVSGSIDLDGEGTLYGYNGSKWVELADGETSFLGTFVKIASE